MSADLLAVWVCPCGKTSVARPRFKPGVPEHVGCGEMTYIEDVR